ncbi:MAG: hypothetical protein INR71_06940 [Terriglobus roseus]|nr:hypothetical protein [Terriglobus roseus]
MSFRLAAFLSVIFLRCSSAPPSAWAPSPAADDAEAPAAADGGGDAAAAAAAAPATAMLSDPSADEA